MEVRGEKVYLNKTEKAVTDYSSPLSFADVLALREQLVEDVQELIDLRADDRLDMTTRTMLISRGAQLDSRSNLLNNITRAVAAQTSPEEELAAYVIRSQQR